MVLVEGLRWSKKRFTREWIRSRQTFARHRPVVAKKKKDIRLAAGLFFFFWRNFGTHGVVDGSTIREYPSEIL